MSKPQLPPFSPPEMSTKFLRYCLKRAGSQQKTKTDDFHLPITHGTTKSGRRHQRSSSAHGQTLSAITNERLFSEARIALTLSVGHRDLTKRIGHTNLTWNFQNGRWWVGECLADMGGGPVHSHAPSTTETFSHPHVTERNHLKVQSDDSLQK